MRPSWIVFYFNRKHIFLLPFIITCFIGCHEYKPTESIKITEDEFIYFEGQVIVDNDSTVPNIVVELIGEITLVDTTDALGMFSFNIPDSANYKLAISDSAYWPMFQYIYISADTNINVNISSVSDDYFPLTKGNWWVYSAQYDYHTPSGILLSYNGTIRWEIIDKEFNEHKEYFSVKEYFSGSRFTIDDHTREKDTLIIDTVREISFRHNLMYDLVTIMNPYFDELQVNILRHQSPDEEVLHNNKVNGRHHHKIQLKSKVGITNWFITEDAHNRVELKLTLHDYDIMKN